MTQDDVGPADTGGSDGSTVRKTTHVESGSDHAASRRRVLAASGAVATAGLAGCSGFLGGDGGSGGNEQFTQEDMGSVATNSVDGIEIVGWTSETLEESFQVTVTVRNTGDRTTGLIDYGYSLTLYDESGSKLLHGGCSPGRRPVTGAAKPVTCASTSRGWRTPTPSPSTRFRSNVTGSATECTASKGPSRRSR